MFRGFVTVQSLLCRHGTSVYDISITETTVTSAVVLPVPVPVIGVQTSPALRRIPAPSFVSTDFILSSFKQVTHDVVAVHALPNKQYASDPIPAWLLKNVRVS